MDFEPPIMLGFFLAAWLLVGLVYVAVRWIKKWRTARRVTAQGTELESLA